MAPQTFVLHPSVAYTHTSLPHIVPCCGFLGGHRHQALLERGVGVPGSHWDIGLIWLAAAALEEAPYLWGHTQRCKSRRTEEALLLKQGDWPAQHAALLWHGACTHPLLPSIQVRLLDGTSLMQTFKAKEQLAAVRLYIELNRKDGGEPFHLLTSFPRRIFTDEDMEKPLQELGEPLGEGQAKRLASVYG